MPAYGSTQLIAADHVLHRLPMPRHSPYALISFTFCIIEEFLLIVVFYPTIKKLFLIVVTSRSFKYFYLFSFQDAFSEESILKNEQCLTPMN